MQTQLSEETLPNVGTGASGRCSKHRSSDRRSWTASASSIPASRRATPSCSSCWSAASSRRCCSSATWARRRKRRTCSRALSPCGCGSPCCSRTSPRRWPRVAARRRRPHCARPGPRPWPTGAEPTAGSRRSPPPSSTVDDIVVVTAGEMIPSDGEIIEGIASVDESAITGESAPVIREAGGDRSA